jgi:hypothetical protein
MQFGGEAILQTMSPSSRCRSRVSRLMGHQLSDQQLRKHLQVFINRIFNYASPTRLSNPEDEMGSVSGTEGGWAGRHSDHRECGYDIGQA